MILILSQDSWETTTEEVMDWIVHLKGDVIRLNGEDLLDTNPFHFYMSNRRETQFYLCLEGREINLEQINVVWFRRWYNYNNLNFLDSINNPDLKHDISKHMTYEINSLSRFLFWLLKDRYWLSDESCVNVNKLHVLQSAKAVGLDIPASMVTNNKSQLSEFKNRHGRIITKCIGEPTFFNYKKVNYGLYTEIIHDTALASFPHVFFPCLVQEMLSKEYEIRVFYLDGDFYSMAIFSQEDKQTGVDFRKYNYERPNRMVPYNLPVPLQEKITRLMKRLGFETGSVDIVRTRDGRDVFLEINPIGQFGMVSYPCNYYLEKKVAEFLIKKDNHEKEKRKTETRTHGHITPTN